ncbi:MAG: ROK family protein [Melioribacteraceae bacterium]|nr:ROK family protein [Melioribacteraceae bacterium]
MKKKFVIAVDLGGTKVLTALLTRDGKIINRLKNSVIPSKSKIVKTITSSIAQLLTEAKLKSSDIEAIALGVPGTVNPEKGIIAVAPNLKLINFNIGKELKKNLKLPILIENDVNIAALGIKKFEYKDKLKNALVVFIGTGIGGALIFNNTLYRGSSFYAGEIGHMILNENGSFTSKPGKMTLEKAASRPQIVKRIKADIKNGSDSLLKDYFKQKKKIKSSALAKAVKGKDKVAIRHITDACRTIGTSLGSLTTLLNIDTIILGGGVVEAMPDFITKNIKSAFDKAVLPEPGKLTKITATKLGDDAPLYGGLSLVEEFLN